MSDTHDADAELTDLDLDTADWLDSPDDDRTFPERPCGDPAMHDRLLAVLRRFHPEGHENVPEPAGRSLRWRQVAVERSLIGCSGSLCADAA